MAEEYYGAGIETRRVVERMLALPATGQEQDWELELSDPSKLNLMLENLNDTSLELEVRSALVLLALHAIEQVANAGEAPEGAVASIRRCFASDSVLRDRARFWWSHLQPNGAVASALA